MVKGGENFYRRKTWRILEIYLKPSWLSRFAASTLSADAGILRCGFSVPGVPYKHQK